MSNKTNYLPSAPHYLPVTNKHDKLLHMDEGSCLLFKNVAKNFYSYFPEIEKDGGDGEGEEEEGADELINPDKKKKAPAEGYESGVTLLFKQAKASDFIMGDKAIHLLNNCHEIVLDEARYFMT